MPAIDLSPYEPGAGSDSDAAAISNAFVAIQGAVNGLDNANVANGAAIAVTKLALPGGTTSWLRADGTWTAPTVYAAVYYKTTEKDVVNTTTKTDLLNGEITIAANAMGVNGCIEFACGGDYLNSSGSGKTITLEWKLGTTVLWDSAASPTLANDADRRAWFFRGYIKAMGISTSQRGGGIFWLADATAATTGTGQISDQTAVGYSAPILTAASSENMASGSKAMALSVTHSGANASTSMRLEYAWVRVVT